MNLRRLDHVEIILAVITAALYLATSGLYLVFLAGLLIGGQWQGWIGPGFWAVGGLAGASMLVSRGRISRRWAFLVSCLYIVSAGILITLFTAGAFLGSIPGTSPQSSALLRPTVMAGGETVENLRDTIGLPFAAFLATQLLWLRAAGPRAAARPATRVRPTVPEIVVAFATAALLVLGWATLWPIVTTSDALIPTLAAIGVTLLTLASLADLVLQRGDRSRYVALGAGLAWIALVAAMATGAFGPVPFPDWDPRAGEMGIGLRAAGETVTREAWLGLMAIPVAGFLAVQLLWLRAARPASPSEPQRAI